MISIASIPDARQILRVTLIRLKSSIPLFGLFSLALLAACSLGPTAPPASARNIQNTAIAGVFTEFALTQAALPTSTFAPAATQAPTSTPAFPATRTPYLLLSQNFRWMAMFYFSSKRTIIFSRWN